MKHRFKRGDIILNKWAGERNPINKFILLSYNAEYGCCLCYYSNKIHKTAYYLRDLDRDEEHFVLIGHAPIDDVFRQMMDKYTMITE